MATAPATKAAGLTFVSLGVIDRHGVIVPPGEAITFDASEAEHVADLKAAGLLGDPQDPFAPRRNTTLPDVVKRALAAQGPRETERQNVRRLVNSPNDLLPAGSAAAAGEE